MLWSDPRVKEMTPTQWLIEMESLARLDERKYEDIASLFKVARNNIIDLLGLNLMPVEDSVTDDQGNEVFMLRRPEDHEIIPLAIMCGNESMLQEISKKNDEYHKQEELEKKIEEGSVKVMNPEDLDSFMDDGDISFPDDPKQLEKMLKWNSDDTKMALKHLVQPIEKKDEHLKVVPVKKASRVRIKKE